jgi:Arc/MetJ family transcription regulator
MNDRDPKIAAKTLDNLHRLIQGRQKKIKTSLSIAAGLIEATDKFAGKSQRSAFVERALRRYLRARIVRTRETRDLSAIDARASITNRESDRLLELQAWPE